MEIIVSGRQVDVDSTLRAYVEEKLRQLTTDYGKLTSARVVMSEERGRHVVEGHLYGKHIDLNATGRSHVVHEAIDEAFDRLQRQLRKRLERIHDHRALPMDQAEQVAGRPPAQTPVAQTAEDADEADAAEEAEAVEETGDAPAE